MSRKTAFLVIGVIAVGCVCLLASAVIALRGATLLGPAPAAVAAMAVILVIAWGWPRQMGAPARLSLSVTLAAVGLVAVLLMLLWPPIEDGRSGAWTLFEPLAVALALFGTSPLLRLAGWLACAGGLIFCLALAMIGLLSLPAMGAVAPVGGVMMIAGWALILVAAFRSHPAEA